MKVNDIQSLPIDSAMLSELNEKMKEILTPKRYMHTLAVAHTASCMAMCHGEDPYRAYLAGLLHDNAKCIPNGKKMDLCRKYNIILTDIEKANPDLLHAKLGSVLAKYKYKILDEEILSAISFHTTGKPDMTVLEKIIYISDYIEIHRKPLSALKKAREAAFRNLDECMLIILKSTIDYLNQNCDLIDEMTLQTYDYYKKGE